MADWSIHAWHVWLIAGFLLAALEIFTQGFVALWFAVGALITGLVDRLFETTINQELLLFGVLSVGLFVLSQTLFRSLFMRRSQGVRTNAERLVGQRARLAEAIAAPGERGALSADGTVWAVWAPQAIPAGALVEVVAVEGARLQVRVVAETQEEAS